MKFKKIISLVVTSALTLTIVLTSTINSNGLPVEEYNTKIEKNQSLKQECLGKTLEELKNEGVLSQNDVDNINKYLLKVKQEKKSQKNQLNHCKGNKERKNLDNPKKYNDNKKKSLIDNLVKDDIITKEQGNRLRERLIKNIQKSK